MKLGAILLGGFIFVWYIVPLLFHAMVKSDVNNLYYGMQATRIEGGSYHEKNQKKFVPYSDRYVHGLE